MNPQFIGNVISSTTKDIGTGLMFSIPQILGIFAALTALCISIYMIRGWLLDNSFSVGGFYLHNVPYAGYNRFRSRKWNMNHIS